MKVIHSFWSKAYHYGRWGNSPRVQDDLFCFALSLHFAKSHFGEIHLVTDKEGVEILGDLPYTTCSTSLDVLQDENPALWTTGKITALRDVGGDVLHIDGDVFILGKKAAEIISGEWDCIVQNREAGVYWKSVYIPIIQFLVSKGVYLPHLKALGSAFNMGIIGIRDNRFLKEFGIEYDKLSSLISSRCHIFPQDKDPNIVLEQSTFTVVSQKMGINVKELLLPNDVKIKGLSGAAEEIGYVHLWGESKYSPKWQEIVRRRLSVENPELYEIVKGIKTP